MANPLYDRGRRNKVSMKKKGKSGWESRVYVLGESLSVGLSKLLWLPGARLFFETMVSM